MSVSIQKSNVRTALPVRREPYWGAQIERGKFIGYRKIDAQRGSWIARARDADTGQQAYRALGELPDYDAAVKAAREWFASLDAGVATHDGPFTLFDAASEYIAELRSNGREKAAVYSEWEFKRVGVIEGAFGRSNLLKLRLPQLKTWREGFSTGMGKGTVNRLVTPVKAAVQLAVDNNRVPAQVLEPWRKLKQFEKADGRRELYLDREERRALLAAASADLRALLAAALTLGARPGELVALRRAAFDARTGTLKLSGKTGPRTVPVGAEALALFTDLAKSKLPGALLLSNAGKPWTRIEWSRQIRIAAEEAKLPAGVCLYTCRHSAITQMISDGLSTADVAHLTGTSLQMIGRHYSQFVQSAVRERLDKVRML